MCHFPETGDNSSLEGDNLFLKDMTLCNHLVPCPSWRGRSVCREALQCQMQFLGSKTEALGGSAGGERLRGFVILLVPFQGVRKSGVREHQL